MTSLEYFSSKNKQRNFERLTIQTISLLLYKSRATIPIEQYFSVSAYINNSIKML